MLRNSILRLAKSIPTQAQKSVAINGKASLSGIMVTRSKSSNSGPKDLVATAANTLLEPGFDQAYVDYLSRENVDGWEIRKAFNDLAGMDLVPEPEIIIAGLKACRKVNDYALTTRILEVVRWKAKSNKAIWPYIVQEIKPTCDELGILLPEEMGYDKPELYLPDPDRIHG